MVTSLFLTILTSFIFCASQRDFIPVKELDVQADYFRVDPLGFIYTVEAGKIRKHDIKSNRKYEYGHLTSGHIYSVDATDPFRTLLFYKDFNSIEFLDRNLTLLASPVQLDDLGYYNVAAVCTSVNGGFWLFDQTLNQLVYISKDLNAVKKSAKLSDMFDQNTDQEQVFMLEKNDYIYLGIKNEGILLFDHYGTYLKTFPIKNISSFQITNETITYFKNGDLYFYNTSNYSEEKLELPDMDHRQVILEKNELFILSKKKLYIYKLNNW